MHPLRQHLHLVHALLALCRCSLQRRLQRIQPARKLLQSGHQRQRLSPADRHAARAPVDKSGRIRAAGANPIRWRARCGRAHAQGPQHRPQTANQGVQYIKGVHGLPLCTFTNDSDVQDSQKLGSVSLKRGLAPRTYPYWPHLLYRCAVRPMTFRISLLGSYGQGPVSDESTLWQHASPTT
eukprot:5891904-Pyramimonas_sp.AAC.2